MYKCVSCVDSMLCSTLYYILLLSCCIASIRFHNEGWKDIINKLIDDLGGEEKKGRLCVAKKNLDGLCKSLMRDAFHDGSGQDQWALTASRFCLAKGRTLPYFESRAWFPDSLQKDGVFPEDLDGLGSLWIHRGCGSSVRYGNNGFSFDSMGRFLFGLQDSLCVVVMWPSKSLLELGVKGHESLEFLDNRSEDEFKGWSENNVKHCPLEYGSAVWCPYGWSVFVATLPELSLNNHTPTNVSHYLTTVIFNKKLWGLVDKDARSLIERQLC